MGSKDPLRGIMAVPTRDFEKCPFGQRLKGLRLSSEYGYKLTYDIQVQIRMSAVMISDCPVFGPLICYH